MNKLKLSLLGTAAAGIVAAGVAWSHAHDRAGGPEFPISIAEAEVRAQEAFARVDADGNGEISSAEFVAAEMPRDHRRPWGKNAGHRRSGMHGDGSRKGAHAMQGEDREERNAEREAEFFEALDTDGNGQLSAAEFDRDHRVEVRKSLMKARAFAHLDSDANGVLSTSEFPGHLQRLKAMDADGNGEVSRDELRDGMRARHNRDS